MRPVFHRSAARHLMRAFLMALIGLIAFDTAFVAHAPADGDTRPTFEPGTSSC